MAWAVAGAALVGTGVSLYKTIDSNHKEKEAKAAAERLRKPFYQIQNEYYQNQNLAEGLAGQGLTSGARDYLTEESQRGFSSGTSAIENTGGSANDIAKLYGVFQNSLRNTAASDSQMQIENIKTLMAANKDLAGQKTTKWSLDEDRDYQNKLKEYKMTAAIENQNKWNGISETVGSLSAFATSVSNAGLLNNGKPQPQGSTMMRDTTPVETVGSQQQIQPRLSYNQAPATNVPASVESQPVNNLYLPEDWNQLFINN